jgi:hypothetical protein
MSTEFDQSGLQRQKIRVRARQYPMRVHRRLGRVVAFPWFAAVLDQQ